MFWQKCGKLLTDSNGYLINCDTCPCPYWAVFVFVVRWYGYRYPSSSSSSGSENEEENPEEEDQGAENISPVGEEISLCEWESYVLTKPVINSCIFFRSYDIRITLTNDGSPVGHLHQDTQGTTEQQRSIMDVKVFKVSPCFETEAEAETWYNQQGNQQYWQQIKINYEGNVTTTINIKGYSDTIYGPEVEQCDTYWECYDMNTWELVYEGTEEPQIPQGEEWDCWEMWGNCRYWCITTDSGAKFQQMNYDLYPNLEDQMTVAIAELNAYVENKMRNPQSWPVLRTQTRNTRDNYGCYSFEYTSGYNYWGEDDGCPSARWIWGERAEITLENFNANKHPRGSTGAKFQIIFVSLETDANCNGIFPGIDHKYYLSLSWGQTYQFLGFADIYAPFIQVECWEEFIGFKSNPCVHVENGIHVAFMEYTF